MPKTSVKSAYASMVWGQAVRHIQIFFRPKNEGGLINKDEKLCGRIFCLLTLLVWSKSNADANTSVKSAYASQPK